MSPFCSTSRWELPRRDSDPHGCGFAIDSNVSRGGDIHAVGLASDGQRLAFGAVVGAASEPQLFTVDRVAPRARTVAVGSAIVELQPRKALVGWSVVEVPGVSAVRLTRDGSNVDPSFTSDGERIGFISDRTGAQTLWSMAADGSDQRPLDLAVAN